MDELGFISINGRLKDMIIRGGENIYPREIEDFLIKHDDVIDVQVVGIPDERMGEDLVAFVIKKGDSSLDTDSLRDFCKGKISHFKIPKNIEFVADYPRTVTGKVEKYKLKQMAQKLRIAIRCLSTARAFTALLSADWALLLCLRSGRLFRLTRFGGTGGRLRFLVFERTGRSGRTAHSSHREIRSIGDHISRHTLSYSATVSTHAMRTHNTMDQLICDDLKAFERRLMEIVSTERPATRRWRVILCVSSLLTSAS
ncbi:unnamed protein product, partial [Oppiella nova]